MAISSAKFILVSSNLCSLLTLTDLSRKVFNRIKFNFVRLPPPFPAVHSLNYFPFWTQFWAVVYNLIAVPIAAGVIFPAGHRRLSPVWSSLAMALSYVAPSSQMFEKRTVAYNFSRSTSVVCSSLLLKLYKEPRTESR